MLRFRLESGIRLLQASRLRSPLRTARRTHADKNSGAYLEKMENKTLDSRKQKQINGLKRNRRKSVQVVCPFIVKQRRSVWINRVVARAEIVQSVVTACVSWPQSDVNKETHAENIGKRKTIPFKVLLLGGPAPTHQILTLIKTVTANH